MERTAAAEAPQLSSGAHMPLFFGASDAAASNLRLLLAGANSSSPHSSRMARARGVGHGAISASRRPSSSRAVASRTSRSSRSHYSTLPEPLSSDAPRAPARAHDNSAPRSQTDGGLAGMTTRSRKRRPSDLKPPPPGSATSATAAVPSSRKRSRKGSATLKKPPPKHAPNVAEEDKKLSPEENTSCCICMCEPEADDLALISCCEHRFCFDCIEKWAERENTCPLCKKRFVKIDRVNKQKRRKGTKNTKKVKQRDQRSDLVPGAALEGLLANFASRHPFPPQSIARLIFSGVGTGFLEVPSSVRGRSVGRAAAAEDSLLASTSDGDDDENPFTGLFRAIHGRSVVMGGHMSVMRPVSFSSHVTTRSYAINMNDRNAGNGAENPLEIESDSDEEEVEVVQVTRPS